MRQFKFYIIFFGLLGMLLPVGEAFGVEILEVPTVMTAPIFLTDDGGNPLPTDEYTIFIALRNSSNEIIYTEEHRSMVVEGVAELLIGNGFIPGTGRQAAAGGLDWNLFDHEGDVTVEVFVEGMAKPQVVAVLGSQPYAYIASMALSVFDDAITDQKIKNGTIRFEDFSDEVKQNILATNNPSDESYALSSAKVFLQEDIDLKNSNEDNVNNVLRDLDQAIENLRQNEILQLQSDFQQIKDSLDGLDTDLSGTSLSTTEHADHIHNLQEQITEMQSGINSITLDIDLLKSADENHVTTLAMHNSRLSEQQNLILSLQQGKVDQSTLENNYYAKDEEGGLTISGLLFVQNSLLVSGNIDVSGTVDGVDVEALDGNVVQLQENFSEMNRDVEDLQNAVTVIQADPDLTPTLEPKVFATAYINGNHALDPSLIKVWNAARVIRAPAMGSLQTGLCTYQIDFTQGTSEPHKLLVMVTPSSESTPPANTLNLSAMVREVGSTFVIVSVANVTSASACGTDEQDADLNVVVYKLP